MTGSADAASGVAAKDQVAMRAASPQPLHALKVNSVSRDRPGRGRARAPEGWGRGEATRWVKVKVKCSGALRTPA